MGTAPEPEVVAQSAEAATRVAVIDPGVHELLIRLDATGVMVGRPDYTDEFSQTQHLPTLGTGLSPSYEEIVRTGPDLILTTHASRGTVLDNLRKVAPTPHLPWLTVQEVVASTREIGRLIGRAESASAMADKLAQELAPALDETSPKVLVVLSPPTASDADLWVIKPNSLHGAALEAAGGRHAIPAPIVGPPTLSIEGLLQIDPEIIVVLIADMQTAPEKMVEYQRFWKRLDMLKSVQTGRVGFMVGRTHFYTGPGVMDFKSALQAKLSEVQAQ
jgi:iron complex transport system substrate-binding protein